MESCAVCNMHFKSADDLHKHERESSEHAVMMQQYTNTSHHGEAEAVQQNGVKTAKCGPCDRQFDSIEALQQHEKDSSVHAMEALNNDMSKASLDAPLEAHEVSLHAPTDDSPWSMYPNLHDLVSQRLEASGLSVEFYSGNDLKTLSDRDYDTNVIGAFTCPKQSCPTKKWTSKKVAISIRMYDNKQYNAVVWHQRCKKCKSLGNLKLDADAYVDRVVYRLGKWLGLELAVPPFSSEGHMDRPHHKQLCEGCKNGHCSLLLPKATRTRAPFRMRRL